jgi:hypothetical protein
VRPEFVKGELTEDLVTGLIDDDRHGSPAGLEAPVNPIGLPPINGTVSQESGNRFLTPKKLIAAGLVAGAAVTGVALAESGNNSNSKAKVAASAPATPNSSTSASVAPTTTAPAEQSTQASPTDIHTSPSSPTGETDFAVDPHITVRDIESIPANATPEQVVEDFFKDVNTLIRSGNIDLFAQVIPTLIDQVGGAHINYQGNEMDLADFLKGLTENWSASINNRPANGYPVGFGEPGPSQYKLKFAGLEKQGTDAQGRPYIVVKVTGTIEETDSDGVTTTQSSTTDNNTWVFTKVDFIPQPDGHSTKPGWVTGGLPGIG